MTQRVKSFRFWVVFAVTLITASGSAYLLWLTFNPIYNNVVAVSQESGLRLVLPRPVPANTTVTHHPSYENKNGVIYTSISVKDSEVTFSQQKRPDTDLEQIDAKETFLVNAGPVYVLKGEKGHLQAIVQTSDSWLMVNADASFGVSNFKSLLESLEAISS